jgi:hypothetical protein
MNKLLLSAALVAGLAGAATAAEIGGVVELEVGKNAAGNYGAVPTYGLTYTGGSEELGASVSLGFENNALDSWSLGVNLIGAGISVGDQGSLFVEGYDGATLADPSIAESLRVTYSGASVALGFGSFTTDLTDIESVQAAYSMKVSVVDLAASVDYNLDTEDYALGVLANYSINDSLAVGGAVTYSDILAYEATVSAKGITGYVNGDEDDFAQNVGAGYETEFNGLVLEAKANYNIDAEEIEPTLGVTFKF